MIGLLTVRAFVPESSLELGWLLGIAVSWALLGRLIPALGSLVPNHDPGIGSAWGTADDADRLHPPG